MRVVGKEFECMRNIEVTQNFLPAAKKLQKCE